MFWNYYEFSFNIKRFNPKINLNIKKVIATIAVASVTSTELPTISHAKAYSNERYKTTFNYPDDFKLFEGDLSGDRKVTAFIAPDDDDTNVSIVFTPIPGDFNRLTAFGDLIGYLIPEGAKVLNEKTYGESYCVEYETTEDQAGIASHIFTSFNLRPAESVVGLTVQSPVKSWDKQGPKLEPVMKSLKIGKD